MTKLINKYKLYLAYFLYLLLYSAYIIINGANISNNITKMIENLKNHNGKFNNNIC